MIPGSQERVVFISGSAAAVYAAQSLILARMPGLRLSAIVLLPWIYRVAIVLLPWIYRVAIALLSWI